MTALVDLHLHTTASDGQLSPEELVRYTAQRGLQVIAVTDHDSTEGLPHAFEAAQSFPNLAVIPGIELGTDIPHGEIHILGLFIRYQDQSFQETLTKMRSSRVDRAKRMVENLASLGMPVDWEKVLEFADGGSVGRPHVARAMLDRGYISTQREAFDKYIGRNGPAYAEREKLTPEEAIALIHKMGGLSILCHPANMDDLETHVARLKSAGLVGIEVYYKDYPQHTVRSLARLAKQYELIPCGGTDYHAVGDDGESIPGDAGPPMETVEQLLQLIGESGRKLVINAPWS